MLYSLRRSIVNDAMHFKYAIFGVIRDFATVCCFVFDDASYIYILK